MGASETPVAQGQVERIAETRRNQAGFAGGVKARENIPLDRGKSCVPKEILRAFNLKMAWTFSEGLILNRNAVRHAILSFEHEEIAHNEVHPCQL